MAVSQPAPLWPHLKMSGVVVCRHLMHMMSTSAQRDGQHEQGALLATHVLPLHVQTFCLQAGPMSRGSSAAASVLPEDCDEESLIVVHTLAASAGTLLCAGGDDSTPKVGVGAVEGKQSTERGGAEGENGLSSLAERPELG